MRAAARVVPAGQVCELPAGGRGDDQLAGIRVRECRPGALEPLRMVEDRRVAARPARREPKLLAVERSRAVCRVVSNRCASGVTKLESRDGSSSPLRRRDRAQVRISVRSARVMPT